MNGNDFKSPNMNAILKWCFAFMVSPGSLFLWAYLALYAFLNLYLNNHTLNLSSQMNDSATLESNMTIASLSTDFWLNQIEAHEVSWEIHHKDSLKLALQSPCVTIKNIDIKSMIDHVLKPFHNQSIAYASLMSDSVWLSVKTPKASQPTHLGFSSFEYYPSASQPGSSLIPFIKPKQCFSDSSEHQPWQLTMNVTVQPHKKTVRSLNVLTKKTTDERQTANKHTDTSHDSLVFSLELSQDQTNDRIMCNFATLYPSNHFNYSYAAVFRPSVQLSEKNEYLLHAWHLVGLGYGLKKIFTDSSELKQTDSE